MRRHDEPRGLFHRALRSFTELGSDLLLRSCAEPTAPTSSTVRRRSASWTMHQRRCAIHSRNATAGIARPACCLSVDFSRFLPIPYQLQDILSPLAGNPADPLLLPDAPASNSPALL